MRFWRITILAVMLVLLPSVSYGLGETIVFPSDEQLLAEADYCVIGTITDQRTLAVDEVVFGALATKELRIKTLLFDHGPQRQEKWIVYLEQFYTEIRCVKGSVLGMRRVKGTHVETNEIREKFRYRHCDVELTMSAKPFPTELNQYVREARNRWQQAATKRRNDQKEALKRVFDENRYLEQNGNAPTILRDVLRDVHVDDTDTLDRMVVFVREKTEPLYRDSRASFVQVIARKNFRAGFDVIRTEAFRRSRQGQNWASETAALSALVTLGMESDIELMKEHIFQLSKQRYYPQPYDAFHALGRLADQVYAYNSDERQDLRRWLERFCTEPTDLERKFSFHKLAVVSLGLLGREESLPLLRKLEADEPGGWNEQAISCIERRVEDEALKQSEQGGTEQPATRPESKSEGSHKPQPESEGRSR